MLIAGVTVLLGLLILGARPALAHEITVTTVIAAGEGSGTDPAAVVDGLRLAIDQSPDVGHAATSNVASRTGLATATRTAAASRCTHRFTSLW
jgi:hypothetical protein